MFEAALAFLKSPVGIVTALVSALAVIGFLVFTQSGRNFAKRVWGDFESGQEIAKFVKLAAVFFLVIFVYWGMRPLKDAVFETLVGMDWQPLAKILSPFVITPLVILYSKLVDMFPRNKVFYVLLSIYGVIAMTFAALFTFYIDLSAVAQPSVTNVLGWAWYVYIESFGSLVVALFWAFTTDITMPESAKRGFPLIYFFGQLGNMLGPLTLRASRFGFQSNAPIIAIISGLMFLTAFVMWFFVNTTPKSQLKAYEAAGKKEEKKESHEEPGFLDGLKLLFKHGYLLAITGVIIFYEVIVTILDFFFKSMAADYFRQQVADGVLASADRGVAYAEYLSSYGTWTGVVATLCVLFGINNIHRKLGTATALLLLPVLVTVAVVLIRLYPTSLAIAFIIMVFSKAVNYALNQPTIKQLYIPTTKDTKYKAQAWIEMFGSRGAKAIGSGINLFLKFLQSTMATPAAGFALFVTIGTGVSFGLIGVWFFVAVYIARTYNKAIKEDRVVC